MHYPNNEISACNWQKKGRGYFMKCCYGLEASEAHLVDPNWKVHQKMFFGTSRRLTSSLNNLEVTVLKCSQKKSCRFLNRDNHYIMSITERYLALRSIPEHYWGILSITEHYLALLSITMHYGALLSIIDHYWALLSITQHYSSSISITEHYWT